MNEPTRFHEHFDTYYKSSTDKESEFVSFSQNATKNLKERIELVTGAKGGYIIYVDYEFRKKFVGVFIVRNKVGTSFSSNNTIFDIGEVQHIDFENLAMACRINTDAYESTDIQYLSFINRANKDSDYFTKWISTSSTLDGTANTRLLLKLLNLAKLPTSDDGKPITQDDFRNRVYNYINNEPNKTVNVSQLSLHFYKDESYLINLADENELTINGEFKTANSILKKLVSIKVKADNIDLHFKLDDFNNKIKYDRNDESQIIISSKPLVDAIRRQMKENEL